MKNKVFKVASIFLLLGICLTAFKNEEFARNKAGVLVPTEEPYMYLYVGSVDVTDGEIVYYINSSEPFPLQIIVSNGNWVIEYATESAEDHIALSDHHDSSDATVYISPDGTPGTYEIDFYLEDVKMATLTIVVQEE